METIRLVAPDGRDVAVTIEIADSLEERTRGLMFRDRLDPGHGMLFVFDAEAPLSFWMKNTLIPLDIAFFDATGAFVSKATMLPCRMDPCPLTPSAGPALTALEISANFLESEGVGPGWHLYMSP